MPAFDAFLKRFGFVKLSRYGLVLTSEGRIMSLRPAVLDDGLGGRIVGWRDGDLAAMELQKWEPARPAAKPAVATRLAVTPPPIPMPKPVPAPPQVAQPPQVEEDDWEWEIALARARVAAEESELAAAQARTPRARLDTIPPPQLPVVTIPPRPSTEPAIASTIDYEDRTSPSSTPSRSDIVRITSRPPTERPQAAPVGVRKTLPIATIPPKETRPGTAPPTIIPVPKLPSIKDRQLQIQPVVSPSSRASRTRFAKGTGPIAGTQVGVPPPPTRAAEKTSPGMPAPTAVVALPAIKRFVR